MKTILYAKGISKSFGSNEVFKNIEISLTEGETLAVIGSSGIGKTTLLNILSGLMEPDCGTVELYGKDITGKPGNISYMQQKDLLLPFYTVLDNVCLPLTIKGIDKKSARDKAKRLFPVFGLEGYESKYPRELSGGMKQRAALMRTYIQSDSVVLLDEPFGALDAVTRRKMQEWYLKVKQELKLSTVIITHDTDEALILADRILVIGKRPAVIRSEIVLENKEKDFTVSESFLKCKKELLAHLE